MTIDGAPDGGWIVVEVDVALEPCDIVRPDFLDFGADGSGRQTKLRAEPKGRIHASARPASQRPLTRAIPSGLGSGTIRLETSRPVIWTSGITNSRDELSTGISTRGKDTRKLPKVSATELDDFVLVN